MATWRTAHFYSMFRVCALCDIGGCHSGNVAQRKACHDLISTHISKLQAEMKPILQTVFSADASNSIASFIV